MISTAIFSRLSTDAGVSAIVGTRVYPETATEAEKEFPFIVYKVEGVTTIRAHDGPTGLKQAIVIVAAEATTYADAVKLGQAINVSLDTVRGTWNGIVVQGCFLADDGERDDVFTLSQSQDLTVYVRENTYQITYEE